MKLEVNYDYDYNELKSGDKFAWEGMEYEKISAFYAVRLCDEEIIEILNNPRVHLYEVY